MKTPINFPFKSLIRTGSVAAFMALASSSQAIIVGPYSVDGNTLHLWHMDQMAVPVLDSASGGTNLTALANGASLTNASFAGFGNALSTFDGGPNGILATDKDAYLAPRTLANGTGDNTSLSYMDPITGAFTLEALVRIDFDPATNFNTVANGGNGRTTQMQIISAEDEANGNRIFQFRLLPIGTLNNNTEVMLEFINVNKAVSVQSIAVPVPVFGPDAIAANSWYHVAVTYDGNASGGDNIKFFWTLLDPSREVANQIGSSSMQFDVPAGTPDFAIGNTGRNPANANFVGLIDEVRISKVNRGAGEMIFSPAAVAITSEPANQTVAVGQIASFSVSATGQNPIGYQWRRNGSPINGATQNIYTIPAAQFANAGNFDVVVTNGVSAATSSVVTLTVRTPLNLAWVGGFDWDTTSFNWQDTNSLANTVFTPGDNVSFDALGAFSPNINLAGVATPSSVIVNADTDYTLSSTGGGAIIGTSKLSKNGLGRLTIDTDNNYTGPTVIQGGSLQLGLADTHGSLGTGPITNNASLIINRTDGIIFNNLMTGTGTLTNLANGSVVLSGTNSMSGAIAVAAGSLTISSPQSLGNSTEIVLTSTANGSGFGGTRLALNGGVVGKTNATLTMLGTSVTPDLRCNISGGTGTNSWNGALVLDGGGVATLAADTAGAQLEVNGPITGPNFTGKLIIRGVGVGVLSGSINLLNGHVSKTDASIWTLKTTGGYWTNTDVAGGMLSMGATGVLPTNITLNITGGALDLAGYNQQVSMLAGVGAIGNTSTNADSVISVLATVSTNFGGVIQDSLSNGTRRVGFTFAGSTLTLTNTNTYSGNTLINGGTLALSGAGAIGNSLNIVIANGATLNVSGRTDATLTVNASQTLKGNGAFNVIGSLVNQGTLEFKVNKTGATVTNDSVQGLTGITYGGTLKLVLSGSSLGTSDSVKLFTAGAYGGNFTTIIPATPGSGLAWDTSTLSTDGTLRVKTSTVTQPPRFSEVSFAGANSVVFRGTNGSAGAQFTILSSDNVAAPLASWTPLSTNNFNGTGSFVVTNTISPGVSNRFYTIRVP